MALSLIISAFLLAGFFYLGYLLAVAPQSLSSKLKTNAGPSGGPAGDAQGQSKRPKKAGEEASEPTAQTQTQTPPPPTNTNLRHRIHHAAGGGSTSSLQGGGGGNSVTFAGVDPPSRPASPTTSSSNATDATTFASASPNLSFVTALAGHASMIQCCAVSEDGMFATGGGAFDFAVRVYSRGAGTGVVGPLRHHIDLSTVPGLSTGNTTTPNGGGLPPPSPRSTANAANTNNHTMDNEVDALGFAVDPVGKSTLLVIGTHSRHVLGYRISRSASVAPYLAFSFPTNHTGFFSCVTAWISPEAPSYHHPGVFIVTCARGRSEVKFWNASGSLVHSFDAQCWTAGLKFSLDGSMMAVLSQGAGDGLVVALERSSASSSSAEAESAADVGTPTDPVKAGKTPLARIPLFLDASSTAPPSPASLTTPPAVVGSSAPSSGESPLLAAATSRKRPSWAVPPKGEALFQVAQDVVFDTSGVAAADQAASPPVVVVVASSASPNPTQSLACSACVVTSLGDVVLGSIGASTGNSFSVEKEFRDVSSAAGEAVAPGLGLGGGEGSAAAKLLFRRGSGVPLPLDTASPASSSSSGGGGLAPPPRAVALIPPSSGRATRVVVARGRTVTFYDANGAVVASTVAKAGDGDVSQLVTNRRGELLVVVTRSGREANVWRVP